MASWGSVLNNIQGAYAQVNPFDNGRTYKTNQAASAKYDKRPAPAKAKPAPTKAAGGNTTPYAAAAYATGGGGTSAANQSNIDYVNKSFDTKLAGLRAQLSTLDPQRQAAELQIGNEYQTKNNRLAEDKTVGLNNLDQSRAQIADSRLRGLSDIARQLQQQGSSYNNQLGAVGAGDSSAAQLVNFALGQQASNARGDLVRNASQQSQAVDQQQADLIRNYERNKQDLDTWKTQQLTDIAAKFLNIKNQIQNDMANADMERQQQLAQYDAAVTQSALQRLSDIQTSYQQQANQLNDLYKNTFAPKDIAVDPTLQQYEVQPISADQLAGLAAPTNQTYDTAQQTLLRKKLEEQQGLTF